MTSILDFSDQAKISYLTNGTQESKIVTSKNTTYDFGTKYITPTGPPISNDVVSMKDFDKKNIKIEFYKNPKDEKRTHLKYLYKQKDGKYKPLNIIPSQPVINNYGIGYPLSDIFANVPSGFNPANKFFDKSIEAGTAPSQQCSFQFLFNDGENSKLFEKIMKDIIDVTIEYFYDNKDIFIAFVKGAALEKTLLKSYDKKELDDEDIFEKIYTEKKSKDGSVIKSRYIDVMTTYFRKDKDDDKSPIEMAIKSHFFTKNPDNGNKVDIHPSHCFGNKVTHYPIICFQKCELGKAKAIKIKTVLNESLVIDIQRFSGVVSSKDTDDILDMLFKKPIEQGEGDEPPVKSTKSKAIEMSSDSDESEASEVSETEEEEKPKPKPKATAKKVR